MLTVKYTQGKKKGDEVKELAAKVLREICEGLQFRWLFANSDKESTILAVVKGA